jgi:hypothetical protein
MKDRKFEGKNYHYWFTSNIKEGVDGPSHRLIKKYGGEVREIKTHMGWSFYYRGVDLNKIPRKAFSSASLYNTL